VGALVGGLPVRLKVERVYLARTTSVQRVRWGEQIRMVDHEDFFGAASGRLLTVLDPGIVTDHARTPVDAEYASYREDTAADLRHPLAGLRAVPSRRPQRRAAARRPLSSGRAG
jgi:hypothetical protein